jgi:hypothetical protein
MNHYFSEEVFLKKLNHPNIVKVHESQRSVAINIPSYLKTDETITDKNKMLSNHNNREFLKDIDRREYIRVD